MKIVTGQVHVIPPLPLRTQARLWLSHAVDLVATWLIMHGHDRLAVRLWRACRMWE